jgi:mutator protein MutT
LGGYWEFPGGKRQSGEEWIACLRRELREELGISVRGVRMFADLRHEYRNRPIRFRVFKCRIARGLPKPLEADALAWVTSGELVRYRFPPANRLLIKRLTSRA